MRCSRPDGGESLFLPVKDLLKGSVVFGNLRVRWPTAEHPPNALPNRGCASPSGLPTAYVRHLKAVGFTATGVANNHACDFGEEGRRSTLAALDQAGIAHSGPPGTFAELRAAGKSIALLAFSTGDLSNNLLMKADEAQALIGKLKQDHDLVLVSFHGGQRRAQGRACPRRHGRFGGEPRGNLVQFSHAAIDAGARTW